MGFYMFKIISFSLFLIFSCQSIAQEKVILKDKPVTKAKKVHKFKAIEPDYSNPAKLRAYYDACLRVYEKELTVGVDLSEEEMLQETICNVNTK